MQLLFCLPIILFLEISTAAGSKILFVTLIPHHQPLLFDMATILQTTSNHNVQFVTYVNDLSEFRRRDFQAHIVRWDLNLTWPSIVDNIAIEDPEVVSDLAVTWCRYILNDTKLLSEIDAAKFDAVIVDLYVNDVCSIEWSRRLSLPIIGFWPWPLDQPLLSHLNIPLFLDRRPRGLGYETMTLVNHVTDWMTSKGTIKQWKRFYSRSLSTIAEFHKADKSVEEMYDEVILIFVNENSAIHLPHPQFEGIVPIGGYHCTLSKPLNTSLDEFLRSRRYGAIFVSLTHPPTEKGVDWLTKIFPQFPNYAIMWEQNGFPVNSESRNNFMIVDRINHEDILGHQRTRVFVTSCSSTEVMSAIYHGVPLLCIPATTREIEMAKRVVDKRIGLDIAIKNLVVDKIVEKMQKIVMDKSFAANCRQLSILFRDQPETPGDRFLYWVEYIIRHRGVGRINARRHHEMHYDTTDVAILILVACLVCIFVVGGLIWLVMMTLGRFSRSEKKGKED